MSDRIFIGPSGGSNLFRISQPGYDAWDLTKPAVFSSRSDYLRLHATVDIPLTRYSGGDVSGNNYIGEAAFPDLGYVPLVFVSITPRHLGRVFFPNDAHPDTSEMNNFMHVAVWTNRIWVSSIAPDGASYQFNFRALIFKNRLDRNIDG